MKRVIVASAILIGIAWFAVARLGGAKTDDEAAIRALEDQRVKAARARDIEGVMAVYAPDVFVFDFIPPRQKVGANAYRENWTNFFVTPLTYEVKDLSVTVVGDVAYSHQINHIATTYDGKPLEGNNRVTDVYRKTKGKWLIVQEHVSVPVDLDTGKADLASKPQKHNQKSTLRTNRNIPAKMSSDNRHEFEDETGPRAGEWEESN